jgi:hypothetical protein
MYEKTALRRANSLEMVELAEKKIQRNALIQSLDDRIQTTQQKSKEEYENLKQLEQDIQI